MSSKCLVKALSYDFDKTELCLGLARSSHMFEIFYDVCDLNLSGKLVLEKFPSFHILFDCQMLAKVGVVM